MTAIEMSDLICELTVNLKSATDNNEELSEKERTYLDGLVAGLKLATDTIRAAIERENDRKKYAEPQDMSEQERWLKGL